jgi:hypothetical protein
MIVKVFRNLFQTKKKALMPLLKLKVFLLQFRRSKRYSSYNSDESGIPLTIQTKAVFLLQFRRKRYFSYNSDEEE